MKDKRRKKVGKAEIKMLIISALLDLLIGLILLIIEKYLF